MAISSSAKSKMPNSLRATKSPIAKDFKKSVESISKGFTSSKTPIGTIALKPPFIFVSKENVSGFKMLERKTFELL